MASENTNRATISKLGMVALMGVATVAAFIVAVGGCNPNGGSGYCNTNTDCGSPNVDYSELHSGQKYCSENQCFTKP